MWGLTDAQGRFKLFPEGRVVRTVGSAEMPTELQSAPIGVLVVDDNYSGLLAPVEWQDLVGGSWRGVARKQVVMVRVVHARSGTPVSNAEVRLLPRSGALLHQIFAIDAFECDRELAQSKFRILEGTEWSATVRLPNSEQWITYPIKIDATNNAKIAIDLEQQVRLHLRDSRGTPVPGVMVILQAQGGDTLTTRSDEQGRASVTANPNETYRTFVGESGWRHMLKIGPTVKARTEPYELWLAQEWILKCSIDVTGSVPPLKALIAFYDSARHEHLYVEAWFTNDSTLIINDAAQRAVVLAPGCAALETHSMVRPDEGRSTISLELKRGPTINVSRTVLPIEVLSPLKGRATAIHVAERHLGDYGKQRDVTSMFSSEFTPSEGDIVFGPFTPGTYELKILDANGQTLWKETRDVK
jgi:hypothetical protein